MILVIPSIDLRDGHCARCIFGEQGTEELYSQLSYHPEYLAKLMRRENAKSVHITNHDSIENNATDNTKLILEIVEAVDIPLELLANFQSADEVEFWLENGMYRVVLNELLHRDPTGVHYLVKKYSSSRIIAGLRAENGIMKFPVPTQEIGRDEEYAMLAKSLGITRLIYTDIAWEGNLCGPDVETLKRIAVASGMRITAAGGVSTPQHLWALQGLHPYGLDSVIVGRALYENKFPCQKIWRMAEAKLEEYSG